MGKPVSLNYTIRADKRHFGGRHLRGLQHLRPWFHNKCAEHYFFQGLMVRIGLLPTVVSFFPFTIITNVFSL